MNKIAIRFGWVDNLKGIDAEIVRWELNFRKIYAKERVKGGGHYASPSPFIRRVARALSCSY